MVSHQGVRFDPDMPQTLRLEFAKSNTKVAKPKQQSPQPASTHPTFLHPFAASAASKYSFPTSDSITNTGRVIIQHHLPNAKLVTKSVDLAYLHS